MRKTYEAEIVLERDDVAGILAEYFDTDKENVRIDVDFEGGLFCVVNVAVKYPKKKGVSVTALYPVPSSDTGDPPYDQAFCIADTIVETKEPASDTKDYPPYLDYPIKPKEDDDGRIGERCT